MDADPSIWTPGAVTAAIGAVGGVIVLILGALTNMIIGLRKKADETAVKVDGQMSALTKERDVLQARLEGLEKLVQDNAANKKVADELAAKGAGQ